MSFRCSSTNASDNDSLLCPRAVYPTISVNMIAASLRLPWDKRVPAATNHASDKSVVEGFGATCFLDDFQKDIEGLKNFQFVRLMHTKNNDMTRKRI